MFVPVKAPSFAGRSSRRVGRAEVGTASRKPRKDKPEKACIAIFDDLAAAVTALNSLSIDVTREQVAPPILQCTQLRIGNRDVVFRAYTLEWLKKRLSIVIKHPLFQTKMVSMVAVKDKTGSGLPDTTEPREFTCMRIPTEDEAKQYGEVGIIYRRFVQLVHHYFIVERNKRCTSAEECIVWDERPVGGKLPTPTNIFKSSVATRVLPVIVLITAEDKATWANYYAAEDVRVDGGKAVANGDAHRPSVLRALPASQKLAHNTAALNQLQTLQRSGVDPDAIEVGSGTMTTQDMRDLVEIVNPKQGAKPNLNAERTRVEQELVTLYNRLTGSNYTRNAIIQANRYNTVARDVAWMQSQLQSNPGVRFEERQGPRGFEVRRMDDVDHYQPYGQPQMPYYGQPMIQPYGHMPFYGQPQLPYYPQPQQLQYQQAPPQYHAPQAAPRQAPAPAAPAPVPAPASAAPRIPARGNLLAPLPSQQDSAPRIPAGAAASAASAAAPVDGGIAKMAARAASARAAVASLPVSGVKQEAPAAPAAPAASAATSSSSSSAYVMPVSAPDLDYDFESAIKSVAPAAVVESDNEKAKEPEHVAESEDELAVTGTHAAVGDDTYDDEDSDDGDDEGVPISPANQ